MNSSPVPALLALALLGGCTGDDDTGVTTGDSGTETTYPGVIRDCAPELGNICPWVGAGYNGFNGEDVPLLDQWLSFPMSVAFPQPGQTGLMPILSDWNNHKLRAVPENPEDGLPVIMGTEFLGDGDAALADRTPAGAQGTDVALNHPTQHVYQSNGVLLSDSWHTHKFREWDPATGLVHVVLGSRPGMTVWDHDMDPKTPAVPHEFDVPQATVLMNQPKELYLDPNDENLVYYVDMRNERIRVWDRVNATVSTIAGEVVDGPDTDTVPGSKGYCGDGGLALEACFGFPKNSNPEPGGAIAMNADGTLMYVADSENHVIRVIDMVTGEIDLLSGTPGVSGFADGPVADAQWYYPVDFAIDHATNELFVADANNHRVRVIDLNTMTVSTVAGNGTPPCDVIDLLIPAVCAEQHEAGDGGPAVDAQLYRPFGVDLTQDGDLVITDTYDHRFRIVYR